MATVQNCINGNYKITTYSGNATWTKDARTKSITVYGWGGGAGGGSGRQGTVDASAGGSGGGVSYFYETNIPASYFGATESVVVGAGGSGGAAQTTASTNGVDGGEGGSSSFGSYIASGLSFAGVGGTTADVGSGRYYPLYTSCFSPFTIATNSETLYGHAGYGKVTAAGDPASDSSSISATGGGGASGAHSTAPSGGPGGRIIAGNIKSVNTIKAGGTQGDTGAVNGGAGQAGNNATSGGRIFGGTGGGGGKGQQTGGTPSNPGNGGAAGFPGAAGGGGGGSVDGTTSGAGGAGAAGQVVVVEYLS